MTKKKTPKVLVYVDARTQTAFDRAWKERGKASRSATIKELMLEYAKSKSILDAVRQVQDGDTGTL